MAGCALCGAPTRQAFLDEAGWLDRSVVDRLARAHPRWRQADGACPACIQEAILASTLVDGRRAFEGRVQSVWPLDANAAFGAIPTPLRMRADPRFKGQGSTIAVIDAAFFPHPDLARPENRIVAWANATEDPVAERWYEKDEVPVWPMSASDRAGVWHGLMTSVTAAGNGWLSHGLYSGLAPESAVVLVQVGAGGAITSDAILRALRWLRTHAERLELRVVSVSVAGDAGEAGRPDAIDEEVAALTAAGIAVVAAAGNDGRRHLLPPATAADAITVGGLDDHNVLTAGERSLWHSNYGASAGQRPKPEVVAPSLWTVAPVLPQSEIAVEAAELFRHRVDDRSGDVDRRIAALRLVTPHYQHVEGTSFAAPIVAAVVACMCQANPRLTPARIKELLVLSATRIADAPDERQGAGVVDAGVAVAAALADERTNHAAVRQMPLITSDAVRFVLHDRDARSVTVLGSWNQWRSPGVAARRSAAGVWHADVPRPAAGRYSYKFLLDGRRWLPDPANPQRMVNDEGQINSVFDVDATAPRERV